MTYLNLTTLSQVTPRSDNDLIHLTQGSSPATADLALAAWHERAGFHAEGCGICDLPQMDQLAAAVLVEAGLTVELPLAVFRTSEPAEAVAL